MSEASADFPPAKIGTEKIPPPSPPSEENNRTEGNHENEKKYEAVRNAFQGFFDEAGQSQKRISVNNDAISGKGKRLEETEATLDNTRRITSSVESKDQTIELSTYLKRVQTRIQEEKNALKRTISSQDGKETENLTMKAGREWMSQGGRVDSLIQELKDIENIRDPQLKAERVGDISTQIAALVKPIEQKAGGASTDWTRFSENDNRKLTLSNIGRSYDVAQGARKALGDKYYRVLSGIEGAADSMRKYDTIEEAAIVNKLNYKAIALAANSLGCTVTEMINAIASHH